MLAFSSNFSVIWISKFKISNLEIGQIECLGNSLMKWRQCWSPLILQLVLSQLLFGFYLAPFAHALITILLPFEADSTLEFHALKRLILPFCLSRMCLSSVSFESAFFFHCPNGDLQIPVLIPVWIHTQRVQSCSPWASSVSLECVQWQATLFDDGLLRTVLTS